MLSMLLQCSIMIPQYERMKVLHVDCVLQVCAGARDCAADPGGLHAGVPGVHGAAHHGPPRAGGRRAGRPGQTRAQGGAAGGAGVSHPADPPGVLPFPGW